MIPFGILIAVAGAASFAWALFIGPIIWTPVSVALFGFGSVIAAIGFLRDAVDRAANRIVSALNPNLPADVVTDGGSPTSVGRDALVTTCPACGTVNGKSSRRCKKCGTGLS